MTQKAEPKYVRLKNEILSWIRAEERKEGDMLPSENELAERFEVSRQTVRQAIGELVREGRLNRVQGKGTFVSSTTPLLHGGDLQTIGIITTYISDYIFPQIVRGAEGALRERGYRLLLSSTDNDKGKERECLEMMMGHPLSGLIIEPTKSAEGNPNLGYYLSLENRRIPYLMINEKYAELDCTCVKTDDELGGYLAADHLLTLGHRRIAGFFKTDDMQGRNRLKGFLKAHKDHGAEIEPSLVVRYSTEEKREVPFAQALALLGVGDSRPTAFVCYNDELAVHLLEAARQYGLGVPDDLSVVGFDDSFLATATEVKLTTLTHPKAEMGIQAAELLISMIEGKGMKKQPGTVMHKPELVVRESTKAWTPD